MTPTDRDDQPWHYARHTDPATSHRAAEQISHKITAKHLRALEVLLDLERATDDMVADVLVTDGIVARHEQGRRLMRTLRERYDYIAPALTDGVQATMTNSSGREGLVWELSMRGVQIALDPASRRIKP